MNRKQLQECELILGNSNRRFSGVTSTMLQNFSFQKERMQTAIMGSYNLSPEEKAYATSFFQLVFFCRGLLPNKQWRIFHARRNIEVVQALILRYIFRLRLRVVFTSTAQRNHSWLTKWLIQRVDGLLSTCDAAAQYLERSPDKIIAHGIQSDSFFPISAEQKKSLFEKYNITTPYACGMFGRVRSQKGVHLFVDACLQAFKHNPAFTALVVGAIKPEDAGFVRELKDKIEQAGLTEKIRFLGEQPFENLPQLFSMMSLVCALSDKEGFGLTVPEAMSSGSAVLATQAGAWPEIIRENIDGRVVAVGDSDAINRNFSDMIAKPERLVEMGRSGRQRVLDHYRVEVESDNLCEYYSKFHSR